MRVSCPSCQTNYNIDDKRIPPGGAKLKCSKCQTLFPIKPGTPDTDAGGAVPLPGNAPSGAVPLPGGAASAAVPLPGHAPSTAVPLPGNAPAAAVPLPGNAPSAAVPLPGNAPASAVPLPGAAPRHAGGAVPLPGQGPSDIPLPGNAPAPASHGAIPLPGSPAASGGHDAIPLPGTPSAAPAPSGAVPLPGRAAAAPSPAPVGGMGDPMAGGHWDEAQTRVSSAPLPNEAFREPAIPLGAPPSVTSEYPAAGYPEALFGQHPHQETAAPSNDFSFDFPDAGGASSAEGAVPLPGTPGGAASPPPSFDFDFAPPPPGPEAEGAVPLPGTPGAVAPPPPDDVSWTDDFAEVPPDEATQTAVPLPGTPGAIAPPPPHAPASDFEDFAMDFGEPPPPAPAPAPAGGASPQAESFDFSDLAPPEVQDFSLDFHDLPSPASAPAPAAAPAPGPVDDFSLDFADLPPAPAAQPAPAIVPPPPAADAGTDPFAADLPSPADPYANAPAAPVDVSTSFGEVDLEYDPLSAPAPKDDLEADLSQPLPPPKPAQAADGLEMLSFIDDHAKDAKVSRPAKKRFHIRRRSGKVFGPFEEGVVVKMLEDGQLLGNEDVSPDGETWSPIGTVPAFHDAIQKLMEAPATGLSDTGAPPAAQRVEDPAQTMERLKNLYEGRMAAVTVVDRRAEEARFRRRIPLLIAAGVLVLVTAAGAGLGATRYGFFALKLLVPSKVAPGTPQFTQLQKAKEAILADTFKSYSEARDTSQSILQAKEYPEVRAVWSQAIFYLHRRYAAAKPAELQRAKAELMNIQLLGEKHPEVVKAFAGEALASGRADEARLLLEDAVIRTPNDPEVKLLLAEAYVARNQPERAIQTLEKVLAQKADSAKAMHALGTLHQRNAERLRNAGKHDEAAEVAKQAETLYARALEADPEHVISAVELAALQILVHSDLDAGSEALDRALADESKALMGPAELARARALHGTVLARRYQVKEAVAEFEEALELDPGSVFARAQLGHIYLAQREYEKAVPLFKEASQKEPTNLDYVDGYLTVLIGAGKMEDALTVLESANGQFPDTPRIAYLDARVNDALDNDKKAEENYLRAIGGDPTLVEANLHLARLYLRNRRIADARAQLEKAIAIAPDDALVNAGMGELLLEEGNLAGARAAFEKAAQKDPLLPDAHLGLSRVALLENQAGEAGRYVDRALELDPRIKGGHLQKGLVLWAEGKLDEAIAALEEAKKNEPSNAKVLIKLGAVKLDKNDLAGAEQALMAALSFEPRNHEANFYRARVKSRRAEHTQAIESMRAALDAAPDNPHYHYEMGIIYREARKMSEAMAEWKATIELDPTYAEALEALGQAHLDRGEFEEAIKEFEAALEVDPSRARLHSLIGDAHFQAAQWDQAVKRYRAALQSDSSLTHVYYKIGRALSEQGRAQEAIAWYRRATDADPENAMPWYYLGFLYKERVQRREAIIAFKAYLARRPDAPDKREIEDEIYDLEQGI